MGSVTRMYQNLIDFVVEIFFIEKNNIFGLTATYKVHISCTREQPLIDWGPFLCLILHKSQQNICVNQ